MLQESIRELVAVRGAGVLDDAEEFRGALDDFLEEREATVGELNLIVDAVRLGGVRRLLAVLDHGGEPPAAVREAGGALARDRGSDDARRSTWAVAVLGFALGRVDDAVVREWSGPSRAPEVLADPAAGSTQAVPHPALETPEVAGSEPATAPADVPADVPAGSAAADEPARPPSDRPPAHAVAPAGPTQYDARSDGRTWEQPSVPAPPERRRRGLGVVLAVVVVVVLVAGGVLAYRWYDSDSPTPSAGSDTGDTGGSGRSADGGAVPSGPALPESELLVSYPMGDDSSGIYAVDAATGESRLVVEGPTDRLPTLSRDRTTVGFIQLPDPDEKRGFQVWLTDLDGSEPRPLFSGTPCEFANRPAYSPDGSQVATVCTDSTGAPAGIFVAGADGSDPQMLLAESRVVGGVTWMSDGRIVYTRGEEGGADPYELWAVDVDSGDTEQLVAPTSSWDSHPDWSEQAGATGLLLFTRADDEDPYGQLWTYDPASGETLPIDLGEEVSSPGWSPDGSQVAVLAARDGEDRLAIGTVGAESLEVLENVPDGVPGVPVWATR